MNNFSKASGFSLIEMLIAILILSISLLALAALMGTTTQNTSFGAHITEAATFAQDKLEEFRSAPWAMIVTSGDTMPGSSGIVYTRGWVVVDAGTLKTITITINWTDRVAHSINMTSVLSQ